MVCLSIAHGCSCSTAGQGGCWQSYKVLCPNADQCASQEYKGTKPYSISAACGRPINRVHLYTMHPAHLLNCIVHNYAKYSESWGSAATVVNRLWQHYFKMVTHPPSPECHGCHSCNRGHSSTGGGVVTAVNHHRIVQIPKG